ncbi:MAG: DUF6249 domain-containing protein [Pseudomonadota bacterium]
MNEEIFIPLAFFAATFGITYVIVLFRHRNRKAAQATLRAAIEKGQELSPEVIHSLTGQAPPSGDRDMRRGLVLLAVALATIGFGWLLDDEDASMVFYGSALFPLLIGLSYLLMTRLGSRTD